MKNFFKNKLINLELRWARTSPKRYVRFLRKKGIEIGECIDFHGGFKTVSIDVSRPSLVKIGSNVSFNKNFTLLTHDWGCYVLKNIYNEFIASSGAVEIGSNIVFGRNVTVLKGVSIGDNCIIGLNSVVSKDIPPNSVAIGSPAKVISSIEDYYKKRKEQTVYEALAYAKSIEKRFKRRPRIEEFGEEFSLFLHGDELVSGIPIKRRLGVSYAHYKHNNVPIFKNFDDFLNKAGIIEK